MTAAASRVGSQSGLRDSSGAGVVVGATQDPNLTTISIWKIDRRGTESRAKLSPSRVQSLGVIYDDTGYLDPIVVYRDPATGTNYMGDGHHRWHVHQQRKIEHILAEVRVGTQRDAILWGIQANARHGANRTEADVEANLRVLLADPEWSRWSDREIARIAGVSHQTVARRRRDLADEYAATKTASKSAKSPAGPLDHMRNTSSGNELGASRQKDDPETRRCRRGDQVYDAKVQLTPAAGGHMCASRDTPTAEELAAADAEIDAEDKAAKVAARGRAREVIWVRCAACKGKGRVRKT